MLNITDRNMRAAGGKKNPRQFRIPKPAVQYAQFMREVANNFSHSQDASVKRFSRGTLENVTMNKSCVGSNAVSMKSPTSKTLQKAHDL